MKKTIVLLAILTIFCITTTALACDDCPSSITIGISGKTMSQSFAAVDDTVGNFSAGQTSGTAAYKSLPGCNPIATEGWARSYGSTTANIEKGDNWRTSTTYTIAEDSTGLNGFGELKVKSTQANEGATFFSDGPASASGYYAGDSKATGVKQGDAGCLNSRAWGEGNSLSKTTITPDKITATNATCSYNASRVTQ
ncbi:hypothetical protein KAJ89_04245 [Candidatus Parcubacteria bacterium]|nr:hypothetical protein [Candidatus Parcubacteria bacterium]